MDERSYTHLVRRLEIDSNSHPRAFRFKLLWISASAYVVLFGTLIVVATLIYVGMRSAHEQKSTGHMLRLAVLALLLVPMFFAVLRMFFMRLSPPTGRPITRDEAPNLFRVLDQMRKALHGPPIHHVLIYGDYNAAISQVPRFGLFGGHVNYLMLGLPYLLGVTHKEMLAAVAHEYGHLCGNHGKLGAWVYRQRRTFGALYQQVRDSATHDIIQTIIAAALHRFMPVYNAYTFVLSRQNEYEADRVATTLVGAEINASSLVRDALLSRWIHHEFWPQLYAQADTTLAPPMMPFAAMRKAFQLSYDEWATPAQLAAAMALLSDVEDTHPSLRERVDATGQPATLPARVKVTAAEALLGATLSIRLMEEFDQQWWDAQKKTWEARYHYVARCTARLLQLSAMPLQKLPLHEAQELALLTAEFDSPQAAKPLLKHILSQPGGPFPTAAFTYGRILIDEGDGNGLDHLEAAAKRDRSLLDDAAHIGYAYLLRHQGEQVANAWWQRVVPA